MKITGLESDSQLLAELGRRIKDARIASSMTQAALASRAGVSLGTVANFESGRDVRLGSLASMMRVLGLLSNFDALIPESEERPSEIASRKRKRQRVRATASKASNAWVWGEDK